MHKFFTFVCIMGILGLTLCACGGSGGGAATGSFHALAGNPGAIGLPPMPPSPKKLNPAPVTRTVYNFNLIPGWNCISFPLANITSTSGFTYYLYGYNGTSYTELNPAANPNLIDPHKGYWTYADSAATVYADGTAAAIYNVSMHYGWNFIAYPSFTPKTFGDITLSYDGQTKSLAQATSLDTGPATSAWGYARLYTYDHNAWTQLLANDGANPFDTYKGYWFWSWKSCAFNYQPANASIVYAVRVRDSGSNPIPWAYVHLAKDAAEKNTLTDADGYASFYGLPDGAYTLEILKMGYYLYSAQVNIPTTGVTNYTLTSCGGIQPTVDTWTLNGSTDPVTLNLGDSLTFAVSGTVPGGRAIAKVFAGSLDVEGTFTLNTTGGYTGSLTLTADNQWKPGTCSVMFAAVDSAGAVAFCAAPRQITVNYPVPDLPAQAQLLAQQAARKLNGLETGTAQEIYSAFEQAYNLDNNNAAANTGLLLFKDMGDLGNFMVDNDMDMMGVQIKGLVKTGNYGYVSDRGNHRLQIINAQNGSFMGWFGKDSTGFTGWHNPNSGRTPVMGSASGALAYPQGLAVSGSNIYIVDSGNHRMNKYNFNGTSVSYVCSWGHYTAGTDGFRVPAGVAVIGSNVYVTDSFNQRVVKLDDNGSNLALAAIIGGPGRGNGEFSSPCGIAAYNSQLYVADGSNRRVQVLSAAGAYVRQFAVNGCPHAIALKPADGEIYITGDSTVWTHANNGTLISGFSSPGHWVSTGGGGGYWFWNDGPGYGGNMGRVTPSVAYDAENSTLLVFTPYNTIQSFWYDAAHNPYWSYNSSYGGQGDGDGQFKRPPSAFARDTGLKLEALAPEDLYNFVQDCWAPPVSRDLVEFNTTSALAHVNQIIVLLEKQITRFRKIEQSGEDNFGFLLNNQAFDSLSAFNGQPLPLPQFFDSDLGGYPYRFGYLNAATLYAMDGAFSEAVSWLYFVTAYSMENMDNHFGECLGADTDQDGFISLSAREGFPSDLANAFRLVTAADAYTGKTGAQHIQAAYQYQKDFTAQSLKAKDAVFALPSTSYLFVMKPNPNDPKFVDTLNYLTSYQQALDGAQTVHFPREGITYNVNCNFKAWYEWLAAHPDIMALAPTLNASDRTLHLWPDGTLGNLLPNGMGSLPPEWQGH